MRAGDFLARVYIKKISYQSTDASALPSLQAIGCSRFDLLVLLNSREIFWLGTRSVRRDKAAAAAFGGRAGC